MKTVKEFLETKKLTIDTPYTGYKIPYSQLVSLLEEYHTYASQSKSVVESKEPDGYLMGEIGEQKVKELNTDYSFERAVELKSFPNRLTEYEFRKMLALFNSAEISFSKMVEMINNKMLPTFLKEENK